MSTWGKGRNKAGKLRAGFSTEHGSYGYWAPAAAAGGRKRRGATAHGYSKPGYDMRLTNRMTGQRAYRAMSQHSGKGLRGAGGPVDEHGVRELILFIENDSGIYRQQHEPIIKNLCKKKKKGVYEEQKAAKLFKYLTDNAARMYTCGGNIWGGGRKPCDEWKTAFSVATRKAAAARMAKDFTTTDCGEYGLAGLKRRKRRR